MKINPTQKNKGFTLIELLVVISIIGLLSSVVLSSMTVAREKAQDSKAVQEVHSAQLAIQMFALNNGKLPVPEGRDPYYCLGGASDLCYFNGTEVYPPQGGWFVFKEKNFSLVNKVYAYLGGTLPPLSLNPTVIVNSSQYKGPIYYCMKSIDPDCSDAKIIFTVNSTSCPGSSSQYIKPSEDTGSVCESPADGVGGEITGSSGY